MAVVAPLGYQDGACDDMVQRLSSSDEGGGQNGLLVMSPPGTGKTLMGCWVSMRLATKDIPTEKAFVLVLTPSAGGNVIEQWRREASRAGIRNVCMYRGGNKTKAYNTWMDAATPGEVSMPRSRPRPSW